MPPTDLQHARALIEEALRLCDANGESLVAAKLQWALDTLGSQSRVRDHVKRWIPSD